MSTLTKPQHGLANKCKSKGFDMENHPRYMTHSPSYGDNATCDVCHDVFDARNTDHDIFNNNWICGKCLDYDDEELAEKLGVEESVITEARS